MSNVFDGTYMFAWQLNQICKGNIPAAIEQLKQLGSTGVIFKIANGSLKGDPVSQAFMDDFVRACPEFKKAGFKVGGWIYQYMTDPAGEVDACFQAIKNGADFIVLDGEVELRGKNQQVTQFGQIFRAKYPDYPLALSSFAVANLHPEVPFNEYNQFVNYMMPQVYWSDMGWSVSGALNTSIASYKKFGKPIIVTGQAYAKATSSEMKEFVDLVKKNGIAHLSWWDWQHCNSDQLSGVKNNILQPVVNKALDKWMVVSGVDSEGLHVRKEANSTSDANYTVYNGDMIHVVDYVEAEGRGWYKTTYGALGGYVWSQYLSDAVVDVKPSPTPVVLKTAPVEPAKPPVATDNNKSKYFTDIPDNMYWLVPFADDLYEKEILKGDGKGHLLPTNGATRSDLVVLVGQIVKYIDKGANK